MLLTASYAQLLLITFKPLPNNYTSHEKDTMLDLLRFCLARKQLPKAFRGGAARCTTGHSGPVVLTVGRGPGSKQIELGNCQQPRRYASWPFIQGAPPAKGSSRSTRRHCQAPPGSTSSGTRTRAQSSYPSPCLENASTRNPQADVRIPQQKTQISLAQLGLIELPRYGLQSQWQQGGSLVPAKIGA